MLDLPDLASSIVDELRINEPHPRKCSSESEVREGVFDAIDYLKELFSDGFKKKPPVFNKKDKQDAEKLLNVIHQKDNLIDSALHGFLGKVSNLQEILEAISSTFRLSSQCQYVIDEYQRSTHSVRGNWKKRACTEKALFLMREFSNKNPSAGDRDTPLCVIASRLFEAATGEHDCNLQRQCKNALSLDRKQPFSVTTRLASDGKTIIKIFDRPETVEVLKKKILVTSSTVRVIAKSEHRPSAV
jgi:hypothetical protein